MSIFVRCDVCQKESGPLLNEAAKACGWAEPMYLRQADGTVRRYDACGELHERRLDQQLREAADLHEAGCTIALHPAVRPNVAGHVGTAWEKGRGK